jgi:hypothetical protein
VIKYTDINDSQTIVLGKSNYGVQINRIKTGSDLVLNEAGNTNGLSTINIKECIELLNRKYQFPSDFSFLVSKIDTDSSLELDSQSTTASTKTVTVNLYTSDSKEKIDLSLCSNTPSVINIPIRNTSRLNLAQYRKYKDNGIDIFDTNSEAFTSRCFAYVDNDTNFDSTINQRRTQYFQSTSLSCNNNCIYSGIQTNSYITCNCPGLFPESTARFNTISLEAFSNNNQDVITCIGYAFDRQSIKSNVGLYTGLLIFS